MSKLLEEAFQEASQLPEEEQNSVAEIIISFLHPDEAEEAEWDALTQIPESQTFSRRNSGKTPSEKSQG
jgi:hypothetical protein